MWAKSEKPWPPRLVLVTEDHLLLGAALDALDADPLLRGGPISEMERKDIGELHFDMPDKEEKRERILIVEEFARFGKVLDENLRDGSKTRLAVVAIRQLMLTGCRLFKIQKLRWEHVDPGPDEL